MKHVTLIFILACLVTHAQNVGIGTSNPQEKLHINGKLKIDTIPNDPHALFVLGTNANGVITKLPKDSLQTVAKPDSSSMVVSVKYGETISVGDVVSVGDGKTGYLGASYPIGVSLGSSYNELTSRTKWLAQKFRSTSQAVGIRAVLAEPFSSSNSIGVYKILLKNNNAGVPGSIVLGTTQLVYSNSSNSGGATSILFIFDPPILVQPNTDYHLVFIAYDSTSGNGSLTAINSDIIPNSNMLTSTNSGTAWIQVPSKDLFIRVYETQTIEGYAYRSLNFDPNTVIDPGSSTYLTAVPYSNFTDKSRAVLGVAQESGVAGETKRVIISGVADVPGNLSIGTYYTVGWSAGQLGTGATRVGMGIGATKLLVTH